MSDRPPELPRTSAGHRHVAEGNRPGAVPPVSDRPQPPRRVTGKRRLPTSEAEPRNDLIRHWRDASASANLPAIELVDGLPANARRGRRSSPVRDGGPTLTAGGA